MSVTNIVAMPFHRGGWDKGKVFRVDGDPHEAKREIGVPREFRAKD
jgi:hypothetical protein